jgi:DnaD/phage-associated family protein
MGVIEILEEDGKNFTDKLILLEPLMEKLEQLVIRDHPRIVNEKNAVVYNNSSLFDNQLDEYRKKIDQLEQELEEEKNRRVPDYSSPDDSGYKRVADFIAKKTGTLLSVKMENELKKWLEELGFTPELLLCMLELSFERNIVNPRDISKIARDLKEYSINTVESLQMYFNNYVDQEKNRALRINQFDPDIAEFGSFTGIDMNAEARKKVYYKWRYDWGFTHQMIMKAGEVMCQRTKNGGLEYIDSVLNNWMSKEIRSVNEAEKEVVEFKKKSRVAKTDPAGPKANKTRNKEEYEFYIPPDVLEELKSNV